MKTLEFYREIERGIKFCLWQELKLDPRKHYHMKAHNSVRIITVTLNINPHYLKKIVALRDELSMASGLNDPMRIAFKGRSIVFEISKPDQFHKHLTLEFLQEKRAIRKGNIATLGSFLNDAWARIDFRNETLAHILISGQTRSGKTNTQQLIGWNLCHNSNDARLLIFDVAKRGYKWDAFAHSASLAHPIITDVEEANRVLSWLEIEIERRAEERTNSPRIFILVDELKALLDDSKLAEQYLSRIAAVGGEFGLHLILATQYPQIQLLGSSELKRNLATRLCGKVDDASSSQNALGLPGQGAELLQGKGDFLLKDASENEARRLAVVKIEDRHIEQLPKIIDVQALDLPDRDVTNSGPKLKREPDNFEPEQVALALFKPPLNQSGQLSYNLLASELSIGTHKAKRLLKYRQMIEKWANENDVRCLPEIQ